MTAQHTLSLPHTPVSGVIQGEGQQMEIVIDSSDRKPKLVEPVRERSDINLPLTWLVRASIAEATEGKDIFVYGVKVDAKEIASPDYLLPAILVAASQTLNSNPSAKSGRGGFAFHIISDENTVLMFKVSQIEVSSPRMLISSIIDVLRQSERDGEYVLDDLITRFGDFIADDLGIDPLALEGLHAVNVQSDASGV
jgi:hypothetical protein